MEVTDCTVQSAEHWCFNGTLQRLGWSWFINLTRYLLLSFSPMLNFWWHCKCYYFLCVFLLDYRCCKPRSSLYTDQCRTRRFLQLYSEDDGKYNSNHRYTTVSLSYTRLESACRACSFGTWLTHPFHDDNFIIRGWSSWWVCADGLSSINYPSQPAQSLLACAVPLLILVRMYFHRYRERG